MRAWRVLVAAPVATGRRSTLRYPTVLCGTRWYSAVPDGTLQYPMVLYSTRWCSVALSVSHCVVLYRAVQHACGTTYAVPWGTLRSLNRATPGTAPKGTGYSGYCNSETSVRPRIDACARSDHTETAAAVSGQSTGQRSDSAGAVPL